MLKDDSELAQALTPEQKANTFESKPRWQRALVMLAGPAANFLLAIGILALIFANSIERQFILEVGEISDSYLVQNTQPRQGDELIAINNKSVSSLQEVRLELLHLLGHLGIWISHSNLEMVQDSLRCQSQLRIFYHLWSPKQIQSYF